jgi:hypothetical protein
VVRGAPIQRDARSRRSVLGRVLAAAALVAVASAAPGPGDAGAGGFEGEAAARLARAQRIDTLLGLAQGAETGERLGDAAEHYRRILELDPGHETAYDDLLRVSADLSPVKDSPSYQRAREILPPSFYEYETRRFVVLSDADPRWTRAQAQRLERTHHQFLRFTSRLKLRPLPLRHKLVCVLFAERDAYQDFARKHDGVEDRWIAGYYAPHTDRVVFYHGDTNPSVVQARRRLDAMLSEVDEMDREARDAQRMGMLARAESIRSQRKDYDTHVSRERRRVDDFAEQIGVATTVHEATHQLLFHTGVQAPHVQYPVWISEGLATAFETSTTASAFGPDHEFGPRREVFDELVANDALIPLRMLVSWPAVPSDEREIIYGIYHQGYALATWMCRFRRDDLRAYLERMREMPPGTLTPRQHLELFQECFGSVEAVERAWLRHERSRRS